MSPHYEADTVTIHKIKCGPYDNNAYLIVCPETNESIVIDAPPDPGGLIEVAKATTVKAILFTHSHQDHIEGVAQVTSAIGAPVGVGEMDARAMPRAADFFLKDGDEVEAGKVRLKVISTPGHTQGSTCLVMGNHLISGDTLFPGGPGKTRSPDHLKQIIESITGRLFVLGDDTTFYPGHGDDGDLKTAKERYGVFASRQHPADLSGDVDWLTS